MRMARRHSRAPRRTELKALRAAVARTFPLMPDVNTRANLFCSMFPETLSRANLSELDVAGWVMEKIEGVAANAWSLTLYTPELRKNEETGAIIDIVLPQEPKAYVGADSGGDDLPGRADTLLLVFRDGEILAFDNCPLVPVMMRQNDGRTGLDGELCVRRRALNDDEKVRLLAATREDAEFGATYLEPQDANEASDTLQFELCYLAHDIMLADNRRQTLSVYTRKQAAIATAPYSERLTRMCDRLQPKPAAEKLVWANVMSAAAGSERVASAEFRKGALDLEIFTRRVRAEPQPYVAPILIMPKQPLRVPTVRYAFYAKMQRTRGVRTDGLIFVGEEQPFAPVFIDADGTVINPSAHAGRPSALKKLKPRLENTFDAKLVRNTDTGAYELYACDRDEPVPSAGIWYGTDEDEIERTMALGHEIVAANMLASDAQLFRPEARTNAINGRSIWRDVICECRPYLSAAADAAIAAVPPPAPDSKEDEERYVAAVGAYIRWQPVLERAKKRRANTYVNFCGIIKAIGMFASRDDVCAHVKQVLEAQRGAREAAIVAAAATTGATALPMSASSTSNGGTGGNWLESITPDE